MRHFYQALGITLTGNYRGRSEPCEYSNQFSEKMCRDVPHEVHCCNSTVTLAYDVGVMPPAECEVKTTLVVWSVGNHPTPTRPGRDGINNAEGYIEMFEAGGACRRDLSRGCGLVWASTHARPAEGSPGYGGELRETFAQVAEYNTKMRAYFEGGGCGSGIRYLDVFNMTDHLTHGHAAEARFMTFDHAHWGMEVNLNKAQLLLSLIGGGTARRGQITL